MSAKTQSSVKGTRQSKRSLDLSSRQLDLNSNAQPKIGPSPKHFSTSNSRSVLENIMGFNQADANLKQEVNTNSFAKEFKAQKLFIISQSQSSSNSNSLIPLGFSSTHTSPPREISTPLDILYNSRQGQHSFNQQTSNPPTLFQTPKSKKRSLVGNITAGNLINSLNTSGTNNNINNLPNGLNLANFNSSQGYMIRTSSGQFINLSQKGSHHISNEMKYKKFADDKVIKKIEELAEKREKLLSKLKSDFRLAESQQYLSQMFAINTIIFQESKIKILNSKIGEGEYQLIKKIMEQEYQLTRLLISLQEILQKKDEAILQEQNIIKEKENDIIILKQQIYDLIAQINGSKQGTNHTERELVLQNKTQGKENSQLVFENIKLQHAVKTLTDKLAALERDDEKTRLRSENQQLTQQLKEIDHKYLTQINKKEQLIVANTNIIVNLKAFQKKAEQDLKYYKTYFDEAQIKTKQLTEENEKLSELSAVLKDRFYMLLEDFTGKLDSMNEMKITLAQNSMKMKKLQERIDRVTLAKSTFIDPPENPDFQEERRFFSSIKYIHSKNLHFVKQCKALIQGIDNVQLEKNQTKYDGGESVDNPEKEQYTKLSAYRYSLPTFFAFVEANYSQVASENKDNSKIPFTFIATIRGILDSKFQEYLLDGDRIEATSSFPEFAFSWLQSFQIDKISRTVVQIDKTDTTYENPEQRLAHFYITLQSPLLSKLWEIISFREFLNEDLGGEELYFYLYCRNALFKGAQLEKLQSTFEIINYVKFDIAEQFIRCVMSKFDNLAVDNMVNQLRNKSVVKIQTVLIDIQLVLRILVEYLRTEKMQRYKLIKALFYSQKGDEKQSVFSLNFSGFRKIFDTNYLNTNELEIARLYRECHCIGKGIVNHDIFFTVSNETGFFIKQLKLKMLDELPQFRTKEKAYFPKDCLTSSSMENTSSWYEDDKNKQMLLQLEQVIEQFGNERMIKNFLLFRQNIENNHARLTIFDLKGRHYLNYIQEQLSYIQNQVIFMLLRKNEIVDKNQIILAQQDILNSFSSNMSKVLTLVQENNKNITANQNKKLSVFQKWMRKKISKWYGLLNSILLSKLLKISAQKLLAQKNNTEATQLEEQEKEEES